MGVSKTSDHIQIKIKMPNPSQEPTVSSKNPNEDFKDMDVLCTLKIKIGCLNSKNWYIKDQYHIQIKINMSNPSQKSPASSKDPKEDLKDINILCTFKIRTESKNSDHDCIKDQWTYSNQDQDAKPQSGTSRIFQSLKWGLKGHWCSLHLQNQNREPKFRSWLY